MKNRQKRGCNQKQPKRDDVTALLPMRNEQKLRRYIFLQGREAMAIETTTGSNGESPPPL